MDRAAIGSAPRRHWAILVVGLAAACLIFTHLGRSYLWEDEGDTAVLASSILDHGVPVAWDGAMFAAPDYGQRLTDDFVMISHPWLQYYAAAASFALFGTTPWAARLPFALAGLATILVVYALLWVIVDNRLAAISAALLVTLNVQFLIYSRQARNYSLHALLTCLLVWQFSRLKSAKDAVLFGVVGVLLFHAHPIGLVALATLGVLTWFQPFAEQRRWFWRSAPVVGLYALPWLVASRAGYSQNFTVIGESGQLVPRLLQFLVECASVAPAVGVLLVGAYLWVRWRWHPAARPSAKSSTHRSRRRAPLFTAPERWLLTACGAVALAEGVANAATHSRTVLWIEGLHQTPAVIPLIAMIFALLVVKAAGSNRTSWVTLMLVFTVTRAAQTGPWLAWTDPALGPHLDNVVTVHAATNLRDRILRTGPVLFVESLFRPNPGVVAGISRFLNQKAKPGDVVITNYAWEALYFHTGLPQGAKIESSFPIYAAARPELPDYVFSAKGVRWIVWRRAWPAYTRLQDCGHLLQQLMMAGARVTLVASIPETLYENRENLHFHRFAGDQYLFPQPEGLPDAQIYRVDWPSDDHPEG